MGTLLTLEQRGFEGGQEENSFWHEMMVSSYQGRTYIEVRHHLGCQLHSCLEHLHRLPT